MRAGAFALMLTIVGCGGGDDVVADVMPPEPLPSEEVAAEAYHLYCAFCHGEDGEGYKADAANALANQQWLASASNEFIRAGIARGRPGTPMSAWSHTRGGPLSDAMIEGLIAHIRGWQTEPPLALSVYPIEGEPARGQAIYDFQCLTCHGPAGGGGDFMTLDNPEFLATATDEYLRYAIAKGRAGTVMPGFEDTLTTQGIDDLVALIRTWQRPIDAGPPPPVVEPTAPPVLNADGPAPDFGSDLYVPVDTVKAAYDAGARMVILDARPPGDYVTAHIAGAGSIPFYSTPEVLALVPHDATVVAYCGCPHAESTVLAQALEASGHPSVHVLDEGYFVWVERGYPVNAGPFP